MLVLALLLLTYSPLRAGDLPSHSTPAEKAQKAGGFAAGTALGTAFAETENRSGTVSQARDAGLYLDTEIALGSGSLKPYALDKRDTNAAFLPGLAGIASNVLREQRFATADNQDFSYSLADAMADALWRKQVVDALYRAPEAGAAN